MVPMWRLRQEEGLGSLAACEALTTGRGEGGRLFLPPLCSEGVVALCPGPQLWVVKKSVSTYLAPSRKSSDGPWCLSDKPSAQLLHTYLILLAFLGVCHSGSFLKETSSSWFW